MEGYDNQTSLVYSRLLQALYLDYYWLFLESWYNCFSFSWIDRGVCFFQSDQIFRSCNGLSWIGVVFLARFSIPKREASFIQANLDSWKWVCYCRSECLWQTIFFIYLMGKREYIVKTKIQIQNYEWSNFAKIRRDAHLEVWPFQ